MATVKTYRRDDEGVLHYRWVWNNRGVITMHEGKVGTKGKQRFEAARSRTWHWKPTATELIRAYLATAEAEGYRQIPDAEHGTVVLQSFVGGVDLADSADARLYDEGQQALDDYLGSRGIGHLDGYDIGPVQSGDGAVLNLFCTVVDLEQGVKAARAVARQLDRPGCMIGTREPGDESPYVLAWPKRKTPPPFSLFP